MKCNFMNTNLTFVRFVRFVFKNNFRKLNH